MSKPLPSFHGFVGQRKIVDSLRDHCQGALAKSEALPHILFGGPSGVGKTHLAKAVAKEMGTTCHFFASRQSGKVKLLELLASVKKGDIVFIDEIHSLPPDCQEALYPAIEKQKVTEVDKETHRVLENRWIQIPSFTLIAATDQQGVLRNALRQRVALRYSLTDYSVQELRQIVFSYAAELKLLLNPQAATRLAAAARGIPRRARHFMQSLRTVQRDLTIELTKSIVDQHLKSIEIDGDNLTRMDRNYLKALSVRDCMSLQNIALQIGFDTVAVQREVEPYLLKAGLVGIESRGRFLTPAGKIFVTEKEYSDAN